MNALGGEPTPRPRHSSSKEVWGESTASGSNGKNKLNL
jgi:hypothetical protein